MDLPRTIKDLPAWWSRQWFWVSSGVLFFLATILIFYKLGQVPHGMTWDEAAIGYNGYAVISKRRDEWLVRLPVSFKSFGDYKAPFAIYVNGLFTYLLGDELGLGMSLWLVRLPFALAGVGAVVGWWLLLQELWRDHVETKNFLSRRGAVLVGTLLLITTPWFLHFARTGFESGMALAFLLWGSWCLLKLLNNPLSTRWQSGAWMLGTVGFLVTSIYTYHSSKIVVPIVAGLLLLAHWPRLKQRWQWVGGVIGLSAVALYPLLKDSLFGHGAERFTQSSLLSGGGDVNTVVATIFAHFAQHFSWGFLVLGETSTLRHGTGQWGVLLPTTLLLTLIGVTAIAFLRRNREWSSVLKLSWLGLAWWLAGIFPAAIGIDSPHSNRALLALPGVLLLATVGFAMVQAGIQQWRWNQKITGSHGEKNTVWFAMVGSFWLIHLVLFIAYLQYYYTVFASRSAVDFKDGYLEALAFVIPYEKGQAGRSKVDQVVFSNTYGQAYIYTLFARKTDPIWYQGGALNTYLFVDGVTTSDLERPNTVVVASGEDRVPTDRANKVIYGSDGEVKFKIYVNQN